MSRNLWTKGTELLLVHPKTEALVKIRGLFRHSIKTEKLSHPAKLPLAGASVRLRKHRRRSCILRFTACFDCVSRAKYYVPITPLLGAQIFFMQEHGVTPYIILPTNLRYYVCKPYILSVSWCLSCKYSCKLYLQVAASITSSSKQV